MNLLRHIVPVLALVFLCEYTLFADNGEADAEKIISPASHTLSLKHDEQLAQLFKKDAKPATEPRFYLPNLTPPSEDDLKTRQQIDATLNKVIAENRFVQFLDENAIIDLPVGIQTTVGVLTYTILIDSLILNPTGSYLFASMSFEAPGLGKIHFRGAGIKFSKTGGIADVGVLELVGNYSLDLSSNQKLIINGDKQGTFVEFDCYGFRQMSLDASVVFSRDQLLPEDTQGQVIPNESVSVNFRTVVSDWNDLIVGVDIPRFQVAGLKGFSFEVNQAMLDLSDQRNAPAIVFPQNYSQHSPFLASGNPNLWRGVYINQVSVYLPPQFESKTEGVPERPSINGYHLLIDDQGFSGMVTGENLIPLDKGKIANWDFSLDELHVAMVANEIQESGLRGRINIPINEIEGQANPEDRVFQYTAMLLPGNEYLFNVTTPDEVNFNLWKTSEVILHPSSHILIELQDDQFVARAHLSGAMTIEAGLKDGERDQDEEKNIKLAGVEFQDLQVSSVKPYIRLGAFSVGTKSNSMGGYPIRVNHIGGGQSGNELFLDMDVTLSLTGNDGGGFGAGGSVRFISEAIETGDELRYAYRNLDITRFQIAIDQGSFAFAGDLTFRREDPVYGNGLNGTVKARFTNISLGASAIFGTKEGFRYWSVDAIANLGTGVPILPGVYINEFGGGASYHMRRTNQRMGSRIIPEDNEMMYVPDETIGLGIKAIAGLKGQNEKLFNAEAIFEMTFRSSGGVKNINFMGNAYLLSMPKEASRGRLGERVKRMALKASQTDILNGDPAISNEVFGPPDTQGAQIYAGVVINYDFDQQVLHANLKAIINVAQGVIQGGGDAVLHFAPDEWYIYIGRPEYANRFNLNLLGLAQADAYFVMGSTVPDSPPPPENVSEILGGINLDYMSDLNALADGQGIGFGASLRIDTGNKTFLIFYGRFQAGVGFDVMMRNYGGVTCAGRGSLGINGWYANGQAYAYFDGNIGVQVKLFGNVKRVDILKIGAAVVAQAKLPNPVWIKGTVGGHFSVLGGLVKGNCSFEVTIGEECEIQQEGSALEGVNVIAQLTPQDGLGDVDVFTAPQAVFNYEMEKEYQLVDASNRKVDFKIALDRIELNGPTGPVPATIQWNTDHTVAVLKTSEILPPESKLTLTVITSFMEKKSGRWQRATANGEDLTESRAITFTTGEAPNYISPNNVAYSYPTKNMLNLYKKVYPRGYIKLIQGQEYLFEEDNEFVPLVRFTSSRGNKETPLSYDPGQKQVNFTFPDLENGAIYQLSLVKVPKIQTNIEGNVVLAEQRVENVDASVTTRQALGSIKQYEEQVLFESTFRTSDYGSFEEKMRSIQLSSGWRYPVTTGVHLVGSNFSGPEPFSREEIYGNQGGTPMIRMQADLTRNTWFYNKVNPLIYENYPLPGGITIDPSVRDVSYYGLVPIRAVQLIQFSNFEQLLEGVHDPIKLETGEGIMEYQLAYFMSKDFGNLRNQAANYLYQTGSNNSILTRLTESRFPIIEKGHYVVDVNYYIPGQERPVSTYRHSIFNPIN